MRARERAQIGATRGDDRVHVVRLVDVADGDRRDADDVAHQSENGVCHMRPYTGFCQGTVWPLERSSISAPASFIARATASSSSSVRPPGAQSLEESRTDSGRSGPGGAHGGKYLERESQAVADRAAVAVRAPVRERREEARQQVAVRHVQLEHVEARLGAVAGAGTNSAMTRSMSARVISRGAR